MKPIVIIAMVIVLLIPINVVFGIESFVDTTKDPQSYIDRYNNEPIYKEWFDTNYPNTTIYDAVGIKEPDLKKIPEWVRNTFVWYAENKISESELLSTIEFLVNENIITINLPQNSNSEKETIVIEEYSQQEINPTKYDSNYSDDFESILWTRDDIGEKWEISKYGICKSSCGGGIAERNDGKLVTALELNMRYPTYNEWKVQSSIYLWESESVAEEIYFSGYKGNSSYRSILSDIKVSNSHEENNCVFGERFYEEKHWFETKCLRNNITYTITVADYSASDDYEGITVQDIGNKLQSKIEEKLNKIRLP